MLSGDIRSDEWNAARESASRVASNGVTFSFLVVLFLVNTMLAQSDPGEQVVTLPGTEQVSLTSSIVEGQEYVLQINFPRGYADTTRTFPVIYVLDAQWDFPLVVSIYGSQYYDGFIPGSVIVGVTWGGAHPNHDSLRARDLTPTHTNERVQSGNAPTFLEFLQKELIPFIEARYRVRSDDRTLMGSSFGGLFTLYAMFQTRNVFHRFVLTSPALAWDDGFIFRLEEQYSQSYADLPVGLFMAQGELEGGVELFRGFVAQLTARDYTGLRMNTRVLEGAGHSGSKAEGYTRGLQSVFERPSLTVDDAVLDQYVGTYELNPNVRVAVSKIDGSIAVHAGSDPPMRLNAASDTEFYSRGVFLKVVFRKDESGRVVGCEGEQYEGKVYLRKVD